MAADDLAPNFQLAVSNVRVGPEIERLISEVVVEYVDGAIWSASLQIEDADLAILSTTLLQWGNEIDLWMGYGVKLTHMGRFIVARHEPSFPADGVVTFTVKAYTADHAMTANSPENSRGKKRGARGRKSHGRVFENAHYDDAVEQVATTYGFATHIDAVNMKPSSFNQVIGQKDYDFVRGLANLTGFLFWVDGDASGKWTAHFRNPDRIYDQGGRTPVQTEKLTFRYNDGDRTSLLEFNPEGATTHEVTRLRVAFKDPRTGKLVEEDIDDEGGTPDLLFEGRVDDELHRGPDSGAAVRIFFGDFSIDPVADRQFESAADAARWAAQWFRRNRENFQVGRGSIIGVESLRCFQEHALEGIGPTWSGDWYFASVRHVMSRDNGYTCDFTARKVVR